MVPENTSGPIDCACLIHGNGYTWDYVDRLYSMLTRHISRPVRLHVYTEEHRSVPSPYIKHSLIDWGISGPKRSWWYKIQLFNTDHFRGPLLYFDLDTVIVDNIDWIWRSSLDYFWAVQDFQYLWKDYHIGINSSIMWFNTKSFDYVWQKFNQEELDKVISKYHGDQDYINDTIPIIKRKLFDPKRVKSWRWQCFDGGYNFEQRRFLAPNTGTIIADPTSVLIFHGKPKPSEVTDPVIIQHWQ
jgi:hypothetical protein